MTSLNTKSGKINLNHIVLNRSNQQIELSIYMIISHNLGAKDVQHVNS